VILALLLSTLTMEEAIERALGNNAELSVARASLAVASAHETAARTLPSPEFRLSTSNFDADPVTVRERTSVGIRFSIPRPHELALKQEIARAREDGARAEIRAAEARVAADVRLAFRRAAVAEERAALARRAVELRKSRRKTVFLQVSSGLKEADEKDLADLAVDEGESELRRAVSLAEIEKRKLARLIEPGGTFEFSLAPDPELLAVPASAPSRTELIERAIALRADLDVTGGTCKQLELTERLAKNGRYPWISFVQVSHRVTPLPDRGPWGWQIGVDLPFFRSTTAAETRIAAAQANRCRVQQQALRTQIQAEVEAGIADLEEVRHELAELERLRAGPGQRALERVRLALTKGRADQVEVLDAEARVLSLRDRWLARRMQYVLLEAQLEKALGGALPAEIAAGATVASAR
jgi:outer membrane protein TolC